MVPTGRLPVLQLSHAFAEHLEGGSLTSVPVREHLGEASVTGEVCIGSSGVFCVIQC